MSVTALEILNEDGEVLHRLDERLQRFNLVLWHTDDWGDSHCLRYVDPYSDTIFNRLQQLRILEELQALRGQVQSTEEAESVAAVEAFVKLATSVPHQYLRFVGE